MRESYRTSTQNKVTTFVIILVGATTSFWLPKTSPKAILQWWPKIMETHNSYNQEEGIFLHLLELWIQKYTAIACCFSSLSLHTGQDVGSIMKI